MSLLKSAYSFFQKVTDFSSRVTQQNSMTTKTNPNTYLFIGGPAPTDEHNMEAGEANDGDAQESYHHHQKHPGHQWCLH